LEEAIKWGSLGWQIGGDFYGEKKGFKRNISKSRGVRDKLTDWKRIVMGNLPLLLAWFSKYLTSDRSLEKDSLAFPCHPMDPLHKKLVFLYLDWFFLSYFLNTLTQSVTANKYIIFFTQNTPPIPYLSSYTVWLYFIRENQNFALYSVRSVIILYEIELEKPENTGFFLRIWAGKYGQALPQIRSIPQMGWQVCNSYFIPEQTKRHWASFVPVMY